MIDFFSAFFRTVFSRYTLALLALSIGALVVWFLGPLLSFGGLHPLQTVEMRVSAIVLLLATLMCLLLRWSMLLVGVTALCLLIWHAGPLLAFADTKPLASIAVRTVLIALIGLAYMVYGLRRLFTALRSNRELLDRWLRPEKSSNKPSTEAIASEELKTLSGIVRVAVTRLRQTRAAATGSWRRLIDGKRYLYELPWYMVVGVPGSGKTTALLNSGCKFPIANQMGAASAQVALATNVGTLNTNWWFTNEAVLIDTAGRYAQQGDGMVDPPGSTVNKNAVEWLAYLGLLRKYRPKAPINGALVTISLTDLVNLDDAGRTAQAATLRARLAELRRELGVRFPVYVIVTKADLLKGFGEYFSVLTNEGREQICGLTLPWQGDASPSGLFRSKRQPAPDEEMVPSPLARAVSTELQALRQRLEDGLVVRLQEEFDLDRRHRLYALPTELGGVIPALAKMVEEIFLDSRYDRTELNHSLRGIYFTSARQTGTAVEAESTTLAYRLRRMLPRTPMPRVANTLVSNRSFFLHDLLSNLVFREAHLVRPALGWELRSRTLRLLGHALVLAIAVWLGWALMLSYGNNRKYLADVSFKTQALGEHVNKLYARFRLEEAPQMLDAARELPEHGGLDLQDPPATYGYGLYAAPPIVDAAVDTYTHLQDQTLLPQVVRRMENALSRAIVERNDNRAFETLRVYLMMFDQTHHDPLEVRDWALRDWQSGDGSRMTDAQTALLVQIDLMFSGTRVVQSPLRKNEGLIQRARAFLSGTPPSARLYERAKAALAQAAPPDFTLPRIVGPQAGSVFTRISGQPLDHGVPGLYTYDGYRELFDKRMPELLAKSQADDAWVMGDASWDAAEEKPLDADVSRAVNITPLLEDLRGQYLTEYAQQWRDFLADIAPATGTTLAQELNVVRQFAAPDSPLVRLAVAAARETTLSRSLDPNAEIGSDKSYFDKASERLARHAEQLKKNAGLRPGARLERQLVDSQFVALREVVTGQSESMAASGSSSPLWNGGLRSSLHAAARDATSQGQIPNAGRPALDAITSLVNDMYTVMAVADTAMATNSLPSAGSDPGTRMRMEAARLPAPFREVLTRLASNSSDKVTQGATDILKVQARAQLDRLLGLMAVQVSEPCKRAITGRYPFVANSTQEVHIDDFNTLFAAGGAADEYFTKFLAPFVDTSVRPWRYKSPRTGSMMVGVETAGNAATLATTGPTLTGELLKLLAARGPSPEAFARIAQIRDIFFRDNGKKSMALKMDMQVQYLDPSITEFIINLDGHSQRYVHGPVQTLSVTWPGPRGGTIAELAAIPSIRRSDTSTLTNNGPWALMRLIKRGRVVDGASLGHTAVEFDFDGRRAVLDINTGGLRNPLTTDVLRSFRCPGRA